MSKFEKIRQGYLTLSTICMLIYVACGILAGIVYAGRYIVQKLRANKVEQQLDEQFDASINGVEEDEVVRNLKAAGWDYV